MRFLSLPQRIWVSFGLLVLLIGLIIAVVYPLSIQGALKEQSYEMIEREQLRYVIPNFRNYVAPDSQVSLLKQREAARSVEHFILVGEHNDQVFMRNPVLKEMAEHAMQQTSEKGRYELTYKGETIFYVVREVTYNQRHAYLISYMWDTYRNEMISMLWSRLLWILLFAGALALLLAVWLSRYLRQPLIILGNRFEEIAKRNWQTSFRWNKDDEFGRLSEQFEHMRQNLVRYDESQKTFIQHASHELKTPIMIIHSYAESVKDGIMPKDSLEDTMDVIISESTRMDQRVKELIYYSKLDTMKDETPHPTFFTLGQVAEDIIERLRIQRNDLSFDIKGTNVVVYMDRDQCQVLIENLIENAMRYAQSQIMLQASADAYAATIQVTNDGEGISGEDQTHLFDPFYKGSKGKFGLGLAIVHKIVSLHHGHIDVHNESEGVSFRVWLPLPSLVEESSDDDS